MDAQTTINLIGGAVLAILGWVGRSIWEAMRDLRADLHELEVEIPKSYVSKDDLIVHLNRIENMLTKIFDRLEQKVDKS